MTICLENILIEYYLTLLAFFFILLFVEPFMYLIIFTELFPENYLLIEILVR